MSAVDRRADHDIDPALTARWSRRAFGQGDISQADLFTLFEAARWAPSARNSQPWRFLYARRDDAVWPIFLDLIYDRNRVWAQHAAALVAVISRRDIDGEDGPQPSPTHAFDAGAAWSHLAHQAHRDGWNTRAMGGFDRARAPAALQVPDDHQIHAIVAIGRPGDGIGLPEHLRALEQPTTRCPVAAFAHHGLFPQDPSPKDIE